MSDHKSFTEARFLDVGGRRLFALDIRPAGPCRGAALYVAPFAEEMNRLRVHAARMARLLAGQGWRCLLPDLQGTGESDGDLAEVEWSGWLDDVDRAGRRLLEETSAPLMLWGVRSGALLAAEALRRADALPAARLLLWQPVTDGKLFLNQTLRLRIASQMVSEAERETSEQIRARLAAGETIEVAGYPLSGRLADALAARRLADLVPPAACRVDWIEAVAQPGQAPAAASARVLEGWRTHGVTVNTCGAACPPVWQVHEPVDAPGLLQATLAALQEDA
ncbi:MAG: hydrolase 2, exosortase A system-associated [Rubrivivax sp. SCN 71-131]|nr:MAG: hydrolase 2, exosortase A system-associated [Rubrivivax sp. SCN 71-131]